MRVSGCASCLGRLVCLVLLTWAIGTLSKVFGWSHTPTGIVFSVVLALLAIRGSGHGRASGTARVTRGSVVPVPVRHQSWATGSVRRPDGSPRPPSPRRLPTSPGHPVRQARDPIPAALRFRILARDGFRCRYCGRPGSTPGVVLHVDHVVPVAAGGITREDNLSTACEECNLGKGVRTFVERS